MQPTKQEKPAAEPEEERKPLLEISTLAPERPVVTIDDIEHQFRLMQDMGAIEHQQFTRDTNRYDQLWQKPHLKKTEQDAMARLLERLFEQTLVDPAAVREQVGDRLTGAMKREVLLTFTNARQLMALQKLEDEAVAQEEKDKKKADEARDSSTTES